MRLNQWCVYYNLKNCLDFTPDSYRSCVVCVLFGEVFYMFYNYLFGI